MYGITGNNSEKKVAKNILRGGPGSRPTKGGCFGSFKSLLIATLRGDWMFRDYSDFLLLEDG